MPVIPAQIGESPGQSAFVTHAASHLLSLGKHVLPTPQSADTRHSSHLPSTQNGEPAPHIESAEQSTHPSVETHPAAHLLPPMVQLSLLLDEVFPFVPELHATAKTPAARKVITAASHCFVVDMFNISFAPEGRYFQTAKARLQR
jgi:hypothetical protein